MKNNTLKTFLALMIVSLFGGTIALSNNSGLHKTNAAVGNYTTDAATYYNSITATSGKQLAAQLHDLITSTHKTYTTYADNGANLYQQDTDQFYDENGNKVSGYIYEFYSGVKWPNAWAATAGNTTGGYNREHCWCQSLSLNADGKQMWGESGGGADMHHIRPVENRLNSSRSNNLYGEISNRESKAVYAKFGNDETYAIGGYNNGSVFEPLDNKKGDVARIIMYVYLHYNSYTVDTLFGSFATTNGSGSSSYFTSSLLSVTKVMSASTEEAALDLLLKWNTSDPVDDIERRRNEQIAIYQGNRNPFIDNSSYADAIWGDGTVTIDPSEPSVNSVSITPVSLNLDLNGTSTSTLSATVSVSNGAPTAVNWTSSDENVATVDTNGVVTAKSVGTTTIKATSTYDSNKYATCDVTVTDSSSSSGGEVITGGTVNFDLSTNSYESSSTDLVTWSNDIVTLTNEKNAGTINANNYLGGDSNNRTSSRFYKNNLLTISPKSGYKITKIVFEATSESYASALDNSILTNATSSVNTTTVTIIPTSGDLDITALISATCGFKNIIFTYESTTNVLITLTSISLDTTSVKTKFYVNDVFNYDNLIVTANYSDSSSKNVTPTSVSTPDMSTTGTKTVTVKYKENSIEVSDSYLITVNEKTITSITASTSKTFYVGETINKDDITVKDNFDGVINDFTINGNSSYMFTYEDSLDGGNSTTKELEISYNELKTTLEVTVLRKAPYEINKLTDTINQEFTGVSGTGYTDINNKASSTSGNKYYINCAGSNGTVQLRTNNSNSGIVSTENNTGMRINKITVSWYSSTSNGRTINIYGKNSAYLSPSDLYSEASETTGDLLGSIKFVKPNDTSTIVIDEFTLSGSYEYIGIRSNSGALYLNYVNIEYETIDSAVNISNEIMYYDTLNQCTTKLDTMINRLKKLSTDEISLFFSSEDYVISKARERLNAWAINQNKTLTFNNGTVALEANNISHIIFQDNSNYLLYIFIFINTILLISISSYYMYKRKKNLNK